MPQAHLVHSCPEKCEQVMFDFELRVLVVEPCEGIVVLDKSRQFLNQWFHCSDLSAEIAAQMVGWCCARPNP